MHAASKVLAHIMYLHIFANHSLPWGRTHIRGRIHCRAHTLKGSNGCCSRQQTADSRQANTNAATTQVSSQLPLHLSPSLSLSLALSRRTAGLYAAAPLYYIHTNVSTLSLSLSLSLSICIHTYIYICICICVCVCVFIYTNV